MSSTERQAPDAALQPASPDDRNGGKSKSQKAYRKYK